MAGGLDIEHLISGLAPKTVKGQTFMAGIWREKVMSALESGNMKDVSKQCKRLKESLQKARGLTEMGGSPSYLDSVINDTADKETIKMAMEKAKEEERIFAKIAEETDPMNRAFLMNLIEPKDKKWTKMSETFWKYFDKVPFERLFQAFTIAMAYWATKDISMVAAENAGEAALKSYVELMGVISGVPGLMVDIGAAVLMSAREGAYGLVTSYQECDDLVSGLHTVKGREDVENKGMTIDQMASFFPDTLERREAMRNFIALQAKNAASRFEGGRWVEDPNITKRLIDRCEPQIMSMWQKKRDSRIEQFNKLYIEFEKLMEQNRVQIIINPDEIPIRLTQAPYSEERSLEMIIKGTSTVDMKKIRDVFAEMAAIAKFLEGGKGDVLFLSVTNELYVDGDKIEVLPGEEAVVRSVYTRPGEHEATLKQKIHLTNTMISGDFEQGSALGKLRESSERAVIRIERDARLFFTVEDSAICIAGKEKIRLNERTVLKALEPEDGFECEKGYENPEHEYVWTEETTKTVLKGKKGTLDIKGEHAGIYHIKVEAFETKGGKRIKFGEARHALSVGTAVAIEAPKNASIGDTVRFEAKVEMDRKEKEVTPLLYEWRLKGSNKVFENRGSFSKRIDYPGNYEFHLTVYQTAGDKKIKVGEAEHVMVVIQSVVSIEGPLHISMGEGVTYSAKISLPEKERDGLGKSARGIISSVGRQLFGKEIMGADSQGDVEHYTFEWFVDGVLRGDTTKSRSILHSFAT